MFLSLFCLLGPSSLFSFFHWRSNLLWKLSETTIFVLFSVCISYLIYFVNPSLSVNSRLKLLFSLLPLIRNMYARNFIQFHQFSWFSSRVDFLLTENFPLIFSKFSSIYLTYSSPFFSNIRKINFTPTWSVKTSKVGIMIFFPWNHRCSNIRYGSSHCAWPFKFHAYL